MGLIECRVRFAVKYAHYGPNFLKVQNAPSMTGKRFVIWRAAPICPLKSTSKKDRVSWPAMGIALALLRFPQFAHSVLIKDEGRDPRRSPFTRVVCTSFEQREIRPGRPKHAKGLVLDRLTPFNKGHPRLVSGYGPSSNLDSKRIKVSLQLAYKPHYNLITYY